MRRLTFIIAILLPLTSATAQIPTSSPADPAPASFASSTPDPVANRLFLMPTGTLVRRSRFYVGNVGLLGFTGGYAPSDLMQISAGAFYPPTSSFPFYATAGVKVQAIEPRDWFGGLAVGADFGFLYTGTRFDYRGGLQSYTLATSLGTDDIQTHFAASAFPYSTYDSGRLDVRFILQSGLTIPLHDDGEGHGIKAIAEFWGGGRSFTTMRTIFGAAGIRSYGPLFTWELAIAAGPRCYGDCDDNRLLLYPFPFAGVTFFL